MKSFLIIVIITLSQFNFAQSSLLFEQQKKANTYNLQEAQRVKSPLNTRAVQILKPINISNTKGLIDTLGYPGPFNNSFGILGQDWILQWFKAPADIIIRSFGVYCTENPNDTPAEAKMVRLNWNESQLLVQQDELHGYYPADGSIAGITSFLDNPERTGNWVAIDTTETEPFGFDLFSDGGVGVPFIPDETLHDYQWIENNLLIDITVNAGDIFGIAIKNRSNDLDSNRIGFLAGQNLGASGWKFYANGRLVPGVDKGWWTREFTFDFLVAVDICYDCNPPPIFNWITQIPSGLDVGPFTIDANITDGNASDPNNRGVASAILYFSNDDGATWNAVIMTGTEPDFSGVIHAQAVNTTVKYFVEATDVTSLTSTSEIFSFYIFGPSPGVKTLLVFNGYTNTTGYPQDYYFGSGEWPANYNTLIFPHDVWAYGPLTAELLNYYTNVLEICTNGPNDINSDAIRAWLEESGTHNYMLAGDEWLGAQSNWTDGAHSTGDFIFDVLGINYEHNDVNYAVAGDENKPSIVYPQSGSLLGGPIFDLYTQVSTDSGWTAPMTYDPEVQNWLDGVDFEADVEVDMKGLAIDGTTVYNIGGHRTLPAGNKIAFFAYDPLSLNSDTKNEVEYFWYGFMNTAPHAEPLLDWFGVPVEVEKEDDLLPKAYTLSQNYPNPFNPSTIIKYALGGRQLVTLKVFDLLGREVAMLVNEEKPAGNYEVEFNVARDCRPAIASGIYFYRLQSGSFVETKKMIVLK